jgi:hypothetical protein
MKKYIMSAIIGMGFGFPITLLCMALIGGYNTVVQEFLIWMVASALYGLLSVVMDSKRLDMPLPVSIGLHFFGCIVITMGAALLCGYVTSLADVLPIVIPSIAIYVVVCFICFLLMKKDEKQINKALQQK